MIYQEVITVAPNNMLLSHTKSRQENKCTIQEHRVKRHGAIVRREARGETMWVSQVGLAIL